MAMKRCPQCGNTYGFSTANCPFCKHYVPNPVEIAAACQRIQESWTPAEELSRRRAIRTPMTWQPMIQHQRGHMVNRQRHE